MKLLIVFLVALSLHTSLAVWVNSDVSRTIDLKTHIVKISTSVTMRNDGPSAHNSIELTIDPSSANKLAYIDVNLVTEGESSALEVSKSQDNLYVVVLPRSVAAKDSVELKVEKYFTRSVTPFPLEITQSQKQLVVYNGNHFFYSPYVTEVQTTTVELSSSVIENFSKFGKSEQEQSTIKYGDSEEYKNVKAFTSKPMTIHFENNSPFLAITKMTRVIEISHWGNIAVEETIDLLHTGARFKGSFSRYDYQRLPNSGIAAVKSFKTILPASSADVYYRDQIGNISTSNLLVNDDSVELEIRPRFPLFGGWKTHYYIGYNLPSYTYLYKTGDLHALRMRFVDHVYDDLIIDDLTVKIILPEGCKQISVSLPYDAERSDDSLHFTYLDTVGRPMITFSKKNLVEQHIQDFTLSYNFNRMMLLQEPMLVVGAFFLLFFTVIIIVRLDFSITHDKASEARMRVQSIVEQVQAQQAKRGTCYRSYEAAIKNYKSNKDNNEFAQSRKSIDKTYRECTAAINLLVPKLREDGVEAHEKEGVNRKKKVVKKGRDEKTRKREISLPTENAVLAVQEGEGANNVVHRIRTMVAQLNKMDQNLIEKYNHAVQLAEKLVTKRITKEQYVGHEQKNQRFIEDFRDRIEELTDSL